MGILDYFKKNRGQENDNDKKNNGNQENNKQGNNETLIAKSIQSNSTSTSGRPLASSFDEIVCRGDELIKVYPSNVENGVFVVPKHIKKIAMMAFSNLKDLHTVIMHDGIEHISSYAFINCKNLVEVRGLENAENLKVVAGFNNCLRLQNITLPQGVQHIGNMAFEGCKSLTHINLPDSCLSVSAKAFAGCENLQTVIIPEDVELIGESAFIGCKNLTLIFRESDKKYMEDIIKERQELIKQYEDKIIDDDGEYFEDESEFDSEEKPKISNDELETLYEDLGVKYRRINVNGKELVWTPGRIAIAPNALFGVKEVVVGEQRTMQTVIKSGYKGKISCVDRENEEVITFDFGVIENHKKKIKEKARKKYYNQTLMPSGGTTNWMLACEKYNYKTSGLRDAVVCQIPIAFDCRIEVVDHTQPKSVNGYIVENEEFCTSVVFYKKELSNIPLKNHIYERAYVIYYPYGARFNKDMLAQIGISLNGLIDRARSLSNSPLNSKKIEKIQEIQKQLLDLLINGTNDKYAVLDIMREVNLPKPSTKIKEAKYEKDYLPYFMKSMSEEFREVAEYKKSQQNDNGLKQ